MKVTVTDKARDHIKSKSGTEAEVTVGIIQVKSGWCQTSQLSVRIGNPGDTSRFDVFEDNGITVYLMKGMRIPDNKVEISLNNYIIAKSLSVKGVRN